MEGTDSDTDTAVDSEEWCDNMIQNAENVSPPTKCPCTDNTPGKKVMNVICGSASLVKCKVHMELKDVLKEQALPFLPAKVLMRFRSVSKDWDQGIMSPVLAHKQSYCFKETSGFFEENCNNRTFLALDQTAYGVPLPSLLFLPEHVTIKSSCHGLLLCQALSGEKAYYICNPVTKEWKVLPEPEYYHGSEPGIVLAFEPSVSNIEAHYQVICPVILFDQPFVYFDVYSSKTRSWSFSTTVCTELEDSTFKNNGFYMKGIVYWETWSGNVLAFDLKNEIHGIFSLLSERGGVLTEMQEELCYIHACYHSGDEYIIDIYQGMELSLKRSVSVHLGVEQTDAEECCVLPYVHGDVVMLLIKGVVYLCNLSDQKVEVLSRNGGSSSSRYLPYVNSLVSVT